MKEEAAGPLGVIGCLTAGFEVLSRNLWLVVLPVLLDLLLWLGPQLSVAPLVRGFNALIVAQPAPDPTTARQIAQAVQLLELFGEQFNLFSLFSTLPLLNVPSLLAKHALGMLSPLGDPRVLLVRNVFALMAWAALLVPVGLVFGFLYLNSLAHRVLAMRPLGERASGNAEGETQTVGGGSGALSYGLRLSSAEAISQTVWKFIRVFLFAAVVLLAGVAIAPLWMLLIGIALVIAQPLGLLVWSLSIGLGSYIVLHLLFVVPGVVLGGRGLLRAIWESIVLIHKQFSSVVGLVVLVVVIYEGLGYVWSLPSGDSWSLLIGILGNACIATGLTAATFVFYQERIASS